MRYLGGRMAVTAFGKKLRKLRIEKDLLLKDMAEHLNISAAQLSAIELGKRSISSDIVSRLIDVYKLENVDEINDIVAISQPTQKVDLTDATDNQKKLMVTFARSFTELSDDRVEEIQKLLIGN